MQPLHEGELSIEPSVFLGRLRLDWTGRCTLRDPGQALNPYLSEAFRFIEERGTALEMHFEELAQFNSSTIAVVVQFIAIARSRNLAVTLVYDAHAKWQAMSFDALRSALEPRNEHRKCNVLIVPAATPISPLPRSP
jgi:hypothetical protein